MAAVLWRKTCITIYSKAAKKESGIVDYQIDKVCR